MRETWSPGRLPLFNPEISLGNFSPISSVRLLCVSNHGVQDREFLKTDNFKRLLTV